MLRWEGGVVDEKVLNSGFFWLGDEGFFFLVL